MTNLDDTIHIAFAINDAYVDHLGVEVLSILDNNQEVSFSFYVLSSDISRDSKAKLDLLLKQYLKAKIRYIHMDDTIFDGFPLRIKHITKEAYYRYALPDILTELDKVLYLDSDLLILGGLRPLWDTDLKSYFIAGSHKSYIKKQFPGYKESIGLQADDTYVNSGVLLLNLDHIRQQNKVQELLDNTIKLKDVIRIQDQDVINITFRGSIRRVDKIYNYTTNDMAEGTRQLGDVVVAHFNTKNKPWSKDFDMTEGNKPFIDFYLVYSRKYDNLMDGLE